MPTCPVNIQPDRVTTKLTVQVPQHLKKAFPVAPFRLDHSGTAQKRSNPAGYIQSFLMLAGCGNFQPLSDERPAPAKPGMQGEAGFVLKNNGFFRPQRSEFFLAPSRTFSRLRPLPEDTRDWPASNGIQVDASSVGPDEPSALHQNDAVSALQPSVHPSGHDSIRTSGAIPPDEVPTGPQSSVSSGSGGRAAFSGSGLRPHPYSPPVSSGSRSSDFGPEPRKSNRVAALRAPGAGWQSLCRSRHPVLSRQGLKASLLLLFEDSMGRYSYLPV